MTRLLSLLAACMALLIVTGYADWPSGIALAGVAILACLVISLSRAYRAEPAELESERWLPYLAILIEIEARTTPHPSTARQLRRATQRLLRHFALDEGDEEELQHALNRAATFHEQGDFPDWASRLPPIYQRMLVLDALRIVYAKHSATDVDRRLIAQVHAWAGLSHHGLWSNYDRNVPIANDPAAAWLKELGLPPSAGPADWQAAHQAVWQQHGPVRDFQLLEELDQVAATTCTLANAAYYGLKYPAPNGADYQFHPKFDTASLTTESGEVLGTCVCWLCESINPFPKHQDRGEVRCTECHALLAKTKRIRLGPATTTVDRQ